MPAIDRSLALSYLPETLNCRDSFLTQIACDGSRFEALIERGLAYAELTNHAKAFDDFDTLCQEEPENSYAFNNRGWKHMHFDRNEDAKADLLKALELNPCGCFLQMMIVLEMMDFVLNMMDFVLKIMDFVLKMKDFVGITRTLTVTCAPAWRSSTALPSRTAKCAERSGPQRTTCQNPRRYPSNDEFCIKDDEFCI